MFLGQNLEREEIIPFNIAKEGEFVFTRLCLPTTMRAAPALEGNDLGLQLVDLLRQSC